MNAMPTEVRSPRRDWVYWTKPALFLLALAPLGQLVARLLLDRLGANPVEALLHGTGDWALRMLLVTLAITPLRSLLDVAALVRFRRMLGLFAFFYASLHFSVYAVLDLGLEWSLLWEDIVKRPYITVGALALVLMLPLALTSTAGWMRRLGRRWKALHRLVYLVAALGVLHYLWLVRLDLREPVIHALVLAVLLLMRRWPLQLRRRSRHAVRSPRGKTALPERTP